MFFKQTTIHHDQQPCVTGTPGGGFVNHAFLQPDGFDVERDGFVNEGSGVF